MRHPFSILPATAAVLFLVGCSPDMPQNPDFADASITVYRAGKPNDLPSAGREDVQQSLRTWWKNTSSNPGIPDYVTYAPDVTIRTPELNINLQKHRTIIGLRDEGSRAWLQYSRASNGDDEALRTALQAWEAQERTQQNTGKNGH